MTIAIVGLTVFTAAQVALLSVLWKKLPKAAGVADLGPLVKLDVGTQATERKLAALEFDHAIFIEALSQFLAEHHGNTPKTDRHMQCEAVKFRVKRRLGALTPEAEARVEDILK